VTRCQEKQDTTMEAWVPLGYWCHALLPLRRGWQRWRPRPSAPPSLWHRCPRDLAATSCPVPHPPQQTDTTPRFPTRGLIRRPRRQVRNLVLPNPSTKPGLFPSKCIKTCFCIACSQMHEWIPWASICSRFNVWICLNWFDCNLLSQGWTIWNVVCEWELY
jgi:hypothetical protein